ncbi:MAG: class I SAM-dependent methyltransferase [Ilumatobacteraceae bacterium]
MPDESPFAMSGYDERSYGEAFADVYDEWYSDLDDDDFAAAVLAACPSGRARILDLGTGTGRVLVRHRAARPDDELAGIDSSPKMLAIARSRPELTGVVFTEGSFAGILPDGPYDVVAAGYNTLFNLPDDDALASCLAAVRAVLSDEGRFVVDCISPPLYSGGDHVGIRTLDAHEVVLSVSRHDPDSGRITGQFVQFTETGGVRLRPWSVRYVSPARLDEIAASCGLVLETRNGDGPGATWEPGSSRHVSTYRLA